MMEKNQGFLLGANFETHADTQELWNPLETCGHILIV